MTRQGSPEGKSVINVSLDTSIVNAIDRERKHLGRSAYLNDLLHFAFFETEEPDICEKETTA